VHFPSDPESNFNDQFPEETSLITCADKGLANWSNYEVIGMWIVDGKEKLLTGRERNVKICLVKMSKKIGKKVPVEIRWILGDIKYHLQFVNKTYPYQNPWTYFQKDYGQARYWIYEDMHLKFRPEGYKGILNLLLDAQDDKEMAKVIMENFSDNQALWFTNQIMNNAKTLKKASSSSSNPKPPSSSETTTVIKCTPQCQHHKDDILKEMKRLDQKFDQEIAELRHELARQRDMEKVSQHEKRDSRDPIEEYHKENLTAPLKRIKLSEKKDATTSTTIVRSPKQRIELNKEKNTAVNIKEFQKRKQVQKFEI